MSLDSHCSHFSQTPCVKPKPRHQLDPSSICIPRSVLFYEQRLNRTITSVFHVAACRRHVLLWQRGHVIGRVWPFPLFVWRTENFLARSLRINANCKIRAGRTNDDFFRVSCSATARPRPMKCCRMKVKIEERERSGLGGFGLIWNSGCFGRNRSGRRSTTFN